MMRAVRPGYASRVIDFVLQIDLSLRLIVAAALGLAVGFEREIHGHPGGPPHAHARRGRLGAVHGAVRVRASARSTAARHIDPTRIAAQIVSGIGFLGAGAILKDGIVIRGLTTAASLWATSAVGMAAGAGEHIIAAVATGRDPRQPVADQRARRAPPRHRRAGGPGAAVDGAPRGPRRGHEHPGQPPARHRPDLDAAARQGQSSARTSRSAAGRHRSSPARSPRSTTSRASTSSPRAQSD